MINLLILKLIQLHQATDTLLQNQIQLCLPISKIELAGQKLARNHQYLLVQVIRNLIGTDQIGHATTLQLVQTQMPQHFVDQINI